MRELLIAVILLDSVLASASEPTQGGRVQSEVAPASDGDSAPTARRRKRHKRHRVRRPVRKLVQLEPGEGYELLNPERNWGTAEAVEHLRTVLTAYHAEYPDAPPVLIGDLSRRGGGRIQPHHSHRTGRDADVRLPRVCAERQFVNATPRTIDAQRTWFLIRALIETEDVQYVFLNYRLQRAVFLQAQADGLPAEELARLFQYPHGPRGPGVIRHEPGHLGHFHVRFLRHPPTAPTVATAPAASLPL